MRPRTSLASAWKRRVSLVVLIGAAIVGTPPAPASPPARRGRGRIGCGLETTSCIRAALGAGALGLAALLLAPAAARGYAFLGGSLALDQRDVRGFDDFSAPQPNSNKP